MTTKKKKSKSRKGKRKKKDSDHGISPQDRMKLYLPYVARRATPKQIHLALKEEGYNIPQGTIRSDLHRVRHGKKHLPASSTPKPEVVESPKPAETATMLQNPATQHPSPTALARPLQHLTGGARMDHRAGADDAMILTQTLMAANMGTIACPGCGATIPTVGDSEEFRENAKVFARLYQIETGVLRVDARQQTVIVQDPATAIASMSDKEWSRVVLLDLRRRNEALWNIVVDAIRDYQHKGRVVTLDGQEVGT